MLCNWDSMLKLGQFATPETCENGSVLWTKNCVYYARQSREIYQVMTYSVAFKASEELWNLLSKTLFSKVDLFPVKDL